MNLGDMDDEEFWMNVIERWMKSAFQLGHPSTETIYRTIRRARKQRISNKKLFFMLDGHREDEKGG